VPQVLPQQLTGPRVEQANLMGVPLHLLLCAMIGCERAELLWTMKSATWLYATGKMLGAILMMRRHFG